MHEYGDRMSRVKHSIRCFPGSEGLPADADPYELFGLERIVGKEDGRLEAGHLDL